MQISVESQVLARHMDLLENRTLLFAGGVRDHFPFEIKNIQKSGHIWSWYFDYAKTLPKDSVTFSTNCDKNADVILFYWTKNKQENFFQLNALLTHAPIGQKMLVIGENRAGVKSVEKMLDAFGDLAKIDSARRCSLYYFELTKEVAFCFDDFWKISHFAPDFPVARLPAVFSAEKLDDGTALLLETLNNRTFFGDVLDLGCGAGVIGAWLKKHFPHIQLTLSDVHALALESTKRTLAENHLDGNVIASDVFSHIEGKFDTIISNPPFHNGRETDCRAVNELISQAKWHLKEGGELRLVANRHLPYPDLLDTHFGTHQVLAKNNKFCVYSVTK